MPDGSALSYRVVRRFERFGFDCAIVRAPFGQLNGYIRIPEDHPWRGLDWADVPATVHGGITFADEAEDLGPGYWLGFDTLHAGDSVAFDNMDPAYKEAIASSSFAFGLHRLGGRVWEVDDVEAEVEDLALQARDSVRGSR